MIHKECGDYERCQRLIGEFAKGKCLNPIWFVRAYYAVIVMLARNMGAISNLDFPIFRSYRPYPTVVGTIYFYTPVSSEVEEEEEDEEDYDNDSCSAYDDDYDDGYEVGFEEGVNSMEAEQAEEEESTTSVPTTPPYRPQEPITPKVEEAEVKAADYYVGKFVNYFVGKNYYHSAKILDYIPAGKKPNKKYWNAIGHNPNYVPKPRTYDSIVVKLENGKVCWPPLNVHTEIGGVE